MKRLIGAAAAVSLLATTAACGSSDSDDKGSSTKEETKTITVYAAASLTSTFTELGKKFEAEHDGVKVKFSFGGSSDLVAQIQQGAPADVFASADTKNMDKATADKLVEGDAGELRLQHAGDRSAAEQPGQGRHAEGPGQAGHQGGPLRRRGPLRIRGREGRDRGRRGHQAGQ